MGNDYDTLYEDPDYEIPDEPFVLDSFEDEDPEEPEFPEESEFQEESDDNQDQRPIFIKTDPKTIVGNLRHELKTYLEPDRGTLSFRHMGTNYVGVPVVEISPNKFLFKILPSNQMKAFVIDEIQILR